MPSVRCVASKSVDCLWMGCPDKSWILRGIRDTDDEHQEDPHIMPPVSASIGFALRYFAYCEGKVR